MEVALRCALELLLIRRRSRPSPSFSPNGALSGTSFDCRSRLRRVRGRGATVLRRVEKHYHQEASGAERIALIRPVEATNDRFCRRGGAELPFRPQRACPPRFRRVLSRGAAALRHVDSAHQPEALMSEEIALIRPVEATNERLCGCGGE